MNSLHLLKAINHIDEEFIVASLSYRENAKPRKQGVSSPLVYVKRIAVIILAVISVSFVILLTHDGVRAAISDAVVTWYDKYLSIEFSKATESTETKKPSESATEAVTEVESFTELKLGYIPSGYELTSISEDEYFKEHIYLTETGEYLIIGFYSSKSNTFFADVEHMEYEETVINGYKAFRFFSEEETTGIITFGNSKFNVIVSSSVLPADELMRVAQTISP